jgi:hypothetical protein
MSKCKKCGSSDNYNFALNIGFCNSCIGEIVEAHEGLVKHIEALKSVCEEYIPANKMDEANNKVILLSKGIREEIGRKLLAKQALEADRG